MLLNKAIMSSKTSQLIREMSAVEIAVGRYVLSVDWKHQIKAYYVYLAM